MNIFKNHNDVLLPLPPIHLRKLPPAVQAEVHRQDQGRGVPDHRAVPGQPGARRAGEALQGPGADQAQHPGRPAGPFPVHLGPGVAGRHRHRPQGVQQGALPGLGQEVPDPLLQPLPTLRPGDHHRQRVPGEPGARRLQADRVHRPAVPRRQGRVPDPRLQDRGPPAQRPGPGGGPTAGPLPDRRPAEL